MIKLKSTNGPQTDLLTYKTHEEVQAYRDY